MTSRLLPRLRIPTTDAAPCRRCRGFTLVELMIAVLILGVLLAVAYPSYLESIRKGRRAEGIAALSAVQQAQERFRANNPSYGSFAAQGGLPALPNSAVLSASANGRYAIAITGNTAAGYTLTATAAGAQANDTACVVMGVQAAGGQLKYGSGASSINWAVADADAGKCWAK